MTQALLDFSRTAGPAYDSGLDRQRLSDQHVRIRDFCLVGGWHTLGEIEAALGYPQASISAQLRHCRKARFGSYRLDKRRRNGGGTWEYRLARGES
jgi:hypothetical protein